MNETNTTKVGIPEGESAPPKLTSNKVMTVYSKEKNEVTTPRHIAILAGNRLVFINPLKAVSINTRGDDLDFPALREVQV